MVLLPGMMLCTLMKAGPARSMECTKKEYHQSVPERSLSRSLRRLPSQTNGIVPITGTNIITRCRNLNIVATGSTITVSTNKYKLLHSLAIPCNSSGISFAISALDASSMCTSGVLPSPVSSSLNATNAAGDSKLHVITRPLGGLGGGLKGIRHLLAIEYRLCSRARVAMNRWGFWRRHSRPMAKAVRIVQPD